MTNWALVADNFQAMLEAKKSGYEFSIIHSGKYADKLYDLADRELDDYDYYDDYYPGSDDLEICYKNGIDYDSKA
jgi:hypothetical protein